MLIVIGVSFLLGPLSWQSKKRMCVYSNPCIYACLFLYTTSCIYIKCKFLLVCLALIITTWIILGFSPCLSAHSHSQGETLKSGFSTQEVWLRFYNTLSWFPLKDFLLLLVNCSHRSLTFPRLNRTTQMQRGEFIRYLSMSVTAVVTKCHKLGSGVGCRIASIYFS